MGRLDLLLGEFLCSSLSKFCIILGEFIGCVKDKSLRSMERSLVHGPAASTSILGLCGLTAVICVLSCRFALQCSYYLSLDVVLALRLFGIGCFGSLGFRFDNVGKGPS